MWLIDMKSLQLVKSTCRAGDDQVDDQDARGESRDLHSLRTYLFLTFVLIWLEYTMNIERYRFSWKSMSRDDRIGY